MGTLLKTFKKSLIDNFVSSIEANTHTMYVFAARPFAFTNDSNPPTAFESYQEAAFVPTSHFIFGKRISNTNIAYLARRVDWTTNTVYAEYDHTDINLKTKDYYVITDQKHVYKCLYTANGTASTTKPTLTQNAVFTTADGYMWKYMYTVSTSDYNNFASDDYIPVVANTSVQDAAYSGIDVVKIVAGGSGYITSTNGTIQSIASNTQIVQLDNTAVSDNDFYNGSSMYITNGVAAGSVRKINQYVVNSSGKWAHLTSAISGLIATQSTYEINPTITITGDGSGAQAVCRASNGVISNVTLINPGNNYTHATVTVSANSSYGSGANVFAYIPPFGGHGKRPMEELGVDAMGITVTFANNESGTIATEAQYRTYGIVRNPKQNSDGTTNYSASTFSQLLKANTVSGSTLTAGRRVVGGSSGAEGYVAFSNSTVLLISGDKTFTAGETVTTYYSNNTISSETAVINAIQSTGDLEPATGEILYMTNVTPISRSNTASETVKLIIEV